MISRSAARVMKMTTRHPPAHYRKKRSLLRVCDLDVVLGGDLEALEAVHSNRRLHLILKLDESNPVLTGDITDPVITSDL